MSAQLPTGPKWLSSVLENQRHISRATIYLSMEAVGDAAAALGEGGSSSRTGSASGSSFVVSWREYHTASGDPEPLPRLNYSLLHTLISLCRADLEATDLQYYNAVVHARTAYFDKTEAFWHQYRGLADTWAATEILLKDIAAVKEKIHELKTENGQGHPDGDIAMTTNESDNTSPLRALDTKLQSLHATHAAHNRQLVQRMEALSQAKKKRDEACRFFSRVKVVFLQMEGGRLRFLAEHLVRGKVDGGGVER